MRTEPKGALDGALAQFTLLISGFSELHKGTEGLHGADHGAPLAARFGKARRRVRQRRPSDEAARLRAVAQGEPSSPTAEDLWLLSEHIYYEVQMTFELAVITLATYQFIHPLTRNAQVEALPMHVRQLVDFFWKERSSNPKYARDAFAADYFAPGTWSKLRPERPELLGEVWEKAGWGVAHLTYGRAHVVPERKLWEPVTICHALAPIVLCFADNVDRSKLNPAWFDSMRPCVERFLATVAHMRPSP